jgi:hypothetical protein
MRAKPAPVIPEALREVIEKQRHNIAAALSALQCISLAMDAVELPFDGPFFPAAVDGVVEMLARTHEALDL